MTNQPFFIPAMLIGMMSIPLIFAMVPKNRFYGFRNAKTFSDEKLWYRANMFGGWLLLVSSVMYLVFAMMYPMTGNHDARFSLWLAHLLFFAVPLFVSVACTLIYLRKL
jgi:hypothetical protein